MPLPPDRFGQRWLGRDAPRAGVASQITAWTYTARPKRRGNVHTAHSRAKPGVRYISPPEDVPEGMDVSEAFLDAITGDAGESRQDRERAKQFIGATFDVLDVSNAVVDAADNHPVDLRGATIGRLDCTDSEFGQRLDLRGATVTETATFDGTYHEIDAKDATISEADATG